MKWLVFSYSLPKKMNPSSRVRVWRKLKSLGAVSPKTGVYILPDTDECLAALEWITAEVEHESGEALTMQVDRFANIPDDKIIDIFRKERKADYAEIEAFLTELEEKAQHISKKNEQTGDIQKNIKKLKKNIESVAKVDFFKACDKTLFMNRLLTLQKSLMTGNLIVVILFSVGTLNWVVLRKMKEEYITIPRKAGVQIKPASGGKLLG